MATTLALGRIRLCAEGTISGPNPDGSTFTVHFAYRQSGARLLAVQAPISVERPVSPSLRSGGMTMAVRLHPESTERSSSRAAWESVSPFGRPSQSSWGGRRALLLALVKPARNWDAETQPLSRYPLRASRRHPPRAHFARLRTHRVKLLSGTSLDFGAYSIGSPAAASTNSTKPWR